MAVSDGRRIARTQLAVDFEQCVVLLLDGVLAERHGENVAYVVELGEEDFQALDAGFHDLGHDGRRQLVVRFDEDLTGLHIDDVGGDIRAFEIVRFDLYRVDLGLLDFLEDAVGDLLALGGDRFPALGDGVGKLVAHQGLGHLPHDLLVFEDHFAALVEGAQNVRVGFEAEGAQEHRAVELALTIDADVEQVLVVVFEFDPAAAIRDDFPEVVTERLLALEEHAGRAVQLADNDALGAVDDEGAVVGHQRDFAEEDFLLLDVTDGFVAGLRILIEDRKPYCDFEWSRVGHAALFALRNVVLELQAYGIAAAAAEGHDVAIEGAATVAEDFTGVERIGLDGRAASRISASGTEMVQALEVAALAFPVPNGVIDELELAETAEIGDRENALKTLSRPVSSRSLGSKSICRKRSYDFF